MSIYKIIYVYRHTYIYKLIYIYIYISIELYRILSRVNRKTMNFTT